jgi:hypothetical protein
MHSLTSFLQGYQQPAGDSPKRGTSPAKETKKTKKPAEQNLTMGSVKQVDLQGKTLNPYQKPKPPSKNASDIVKRMAPGK